MTEILESGYDSKHCPTCSQILPLTEFGICRARKDGRNLYCKSCIRKKVTESRRVLKAYKSVREQYATQIVLDEAPVGELEDSDDQSQTRQIIRMTPVQRVREAINNGARTQQDRAQ